MSEDMDDDKVLNDLLLNGYAMGTLIDSLGEQGYNELTDRIEDNQDKE